MEQKRCKAKNTAGKRCELERNHHFRQILVTHKRGPVTWNDANQRRGHTAARSIFDEALTFNTMDFGDARAKAAKQADEFRRAFLNSRVDGSYTLPVKSVHLGGTNITDFLAAPEIKAQPYGAPVPTEPPPPTPQEQLAAWWREKAEAEIGQTVAKAIEYGASDLVDIGYSIARVADKELSEQEAAEWGVFFYLEGKLSRWRAALERGDLPSEDTLLDIGVYARMAQRIRETGGWPGIDQGDEASADREIFHSMCDTPCGEGCK